MYNLIELEKEINNFLQKNVDFTLENKSLKSGKLILFSIKGFYLTFTLQINGRLIVFELPYPFKMITISKTIEFDYSMDKLLQDNIDAQCRDLLFLGKKPHKYLNHIIILKEKLS